MPTLSRRTLLTSGTLAAAAGLVSTHPAWAYGAATAAAANPFTLGVASGDPTEDGIVLWTRLAVTPLASDGLGGMPAQPVEVQWQLARDSAFSSIERSGIVPAVRAEGHSVHVEISGLQPGREYWYRFRVGTHLSPVGRTRTTPPAGSLSTPLTLGVASCAEWEHGWFTAYRRMADDGVDLVTHLGDYIYELGVLGYPGYPVVRHMVGVETYTLADYRRRHALYKTDPDLQYAHAACPWTVVFDDHEVDNNWAAEYSELTGKSPTFAARRAAAFQAYWENMPLRRTAFPRGGSMSLHRRITWGSLATLHMLDTRQYRDDQPCGGLLGPCTGAADPTRSVLGDAQRDWLLSGFRDSRARWDVLGNQVPFAQMDMAKGPAFVTSVDGWDGYLADKTRIMNGWQEAGVRNPVVFTGDIHASYAMDLQQQLDGTVRTVGTEFIATSITSGGDGSAVNRTSDPENPHLRYYDNRRGYLRANFSPTELRVDYRVMDKVSVKGSGVSTATSLILADGQRGLKN